jgi:hypothetical protein
MGKAQILCGQKFGRWNVGPRGPNDVWGARQWVCRCECGKFECIPSYSLTSGRSTSCGCGNRGSNHWNWQGGRGVTSHGYVYLLDPLHPNSDKKGRVLEHKKVMSDYLERTLLPQETVHHKNGIRTDNRIENLELWTSRHSRGQRVGDLVGWAKEILELYG